MTEEALFARAVALPAADRAAFLDRECPDPALRARVAALLAADAGPETRHAPAVPSSDEAGVILAGKYKLVERIGEGGMGSVWLANQSEPVRRKVAVKLVKAGMDSKQVLARFEAERQALAMMDHPNIARVLDAGLAPDGRPFFVMELVKGLPITAYCDARKLTPRERLELFVPVCQAIQHAHQKGIIHRDIKPSNVIVALYDDRPVPKVIDFGVAKATGQQLSEHTINTGFGGVVGTPQYMSPEQATLNNLDIDTRSDVYSLGVLLYELLAGSPPFARKDLEERGLLEILRTVREVEPPKPSAKLSTADALPTLSANRGTEPRKLTALLRSELDWIVLKALEKERSRRYESATAFAADVQRYLAGETVVAHPPTMAYRLRKFYRKNRGPVIAAGLMIAVLCAGILGTTLALVEARTQGAAAKRQEQLAKQEAMEKEREAGEKEKALAAAQAAEETARREAGQARAAEQQVREEQARTQEEQARAQAARDAAEVALVHGYLRPIGHDKNLQRLVLVELARQPDAIKFRFLKEALADGERASRVEQKAEEVVQAAVGLSPRRRQSALELMLAVQRDATADPRSRVAAFWIAVELGGEDLPAISVALDSWVAKKDKKGTDVRIREVCEQDASRWLILCAHTNSPLYRAQISRAADKHLERIAGSKVDYSNSTEVSTLSRVGITGMSPDAAQSRLDALVGLIARSGGERLLYAIRDTVPYFLYCIKAPARTRVLDQLLEAFAKYVSRATVSEDSHDNRGYYLSGLINPTIDMMASSQAIKAIDIFLECKSRRLTYDWPIERLLGRLQNAEKLIAVNRAYDMSIANVISGKEALVLAGLDTLRDLLPRLEPNQISRMSSATLAATRHTIPAVRTQAFVTISWLAKNLTPTQAFLAGEAASQALGNLDKHGGGVQVVNAFESVSARVDPIWYDIKRETAIRAQWNAMTHRSDADELHNIATTYASLLRTGSWGCNPTCTYSDRPSAPNETDPDDVDVPCDQPPAPSPAIEPLVALVEKSTNRKEIIGLFIKLLDISDPSDSVFADRLLSLLMAKVNADPRRQRSPYEEDSLLHQGWMSSVDGRLISRLNPSSAERMFRWLAEPINGVSYGDGSVYERARLLQHLCSRLDPSKFSDTVRKSFDAIFDSLSRSLMVEQGNYDNIDWLLQSIINTFEPLVRMQLAMALERIQTNPKAESALIEEIFSIVRTLPADLQPALLTRLGARMRSHQEYCSVQGLAWHPTRTHLDLEELTWGKGGEPYVLALATRLFEPDRVGDYRRLVLNKLQEVVNAKITDPATLAATFGLAADPFTAFVTAGAMTAGKQKWIVREDPVQFHNVYDAAKWLAEHHPEIDLDRPYQDPPRLAK